VIPRPLPSGSRPPAVLFILLLAFAGRAVPASAQANVVGRVIDSEFGQPVPGATIQIRGGPLITADSAGRFVAHDVEGGRAEIIVKALGYSTGVFDVDIPSEGLLDRVFGIDFTGDQLSPVVVQARAQQLVPRYMDFERRRERGLGTYLRWDDLASMGYNSVGDALRTVRGIRIRCNQQTFECNAYLSRTPHCQPAWWVDGMEVGSFHENTPIRDVYGIEVYRGAGEVPAEFAGSTAGCGVIVVWTKSRPFQNR